MALLLTLALAATGRAATVPLPAGVALTDPTGKLSVAMLLPPEGGPGCSGFVPDRRGEPWRICGRYLSVPGYARVYSAGRSLSGAAWTRAGLLAASGEELGRLMIMAGQERRATGGLFFSRLASFRGRALTLFSGRNDALYLLSAGPAGKANELYLSGETRKGWKSVLLLSTDRPVGAVAGDGLRTAFSSGREIVMLGPRGSRSVFTHPSEEITALAYGADQGLFYATKRGVGFVGSSFHLDLLSAANASLAFAGDSLLVMLGDTGAVLKLDGLSALRALDRAVLAKNR